MKQEKSLLNDEKEPMQTLFYREDKNQFVFYWHTEKAYYYEYEQIILGLKSEPLAIKHLNKLTYIGIVD